MAYGSVQAWLGNTAYENAAKQRFCAAWQCPQEFWETRTFTMLQQSAGGAATLVLPDLRRAVLNDSASATAWANLAEAQRDARQFPLAKYSFQRALAAGPGSPAILFRAANFAFMTGDSAETMRDLSSILRNPELNTYYPAAFLTYSRLNLSIEQLLNHGIPALTTAAEPFLQFWMDDDKVAEAAATWSWMVKHSLTSEKASGAYTAFLIRNNNVAAAAQEWRQANPKVASSYQVLNWIFNPGFESEPKPGPFDWHVETTPDVEASRVQDISRDGQWSVKLFFAGQNNVDYHGVYQEAVIAPGQWHLRAFMKVEGITTDQGVALRIYDPQLSSRLDVRTDARTGTSPWTEVEKTFTVPPGTSLVRVEVMREASRRIDSKIAGRAWVDSLDLSPTR